MKAAVIGCGLRTPLLLHGLARAQEDLHLEEVRLYDSAPGRAAMMATLGGAVTEGSGMRLRAARGLEEAVEGCGFVISSIRPGGMEGRARDERIALEHGFAGQETTGPAGLAMALRSVPGAVEQARAVERVAPEAWLVSFTNPAGMVTQAIRTHTGARAVGICDTPAELFFRIAEAMHERVENVTCDYTGLNHLGWVRAVRLRGEDVTGALLDDDALLRRLYPAELFPPELIRALRLIPTEYVYFYQRQKAALENMKRAGATRAEELLRMNGEVMGELEAAVEAGEAAGGMAAYRSYLNRRNASYLRLEGAGESALAGAAPDWDPFEGATGYHRIAVEAMRGLSSREPRRMVLNVENGRAMEELEPEDVIETQCLVDESGAVPVAAERLPEAARALVMGVKAYERLAIRAAMEGSLELAILALAVNPICGDWDRAREVVEAMVAGDEEHLGYLRSGSVPEARRSMV